MKNRLPNGVMLNAYPDSIGETLSDTVTLLQMPALRGVFSQFYVLPTLFNSDLDRGFSIVDYGLNAHLVSPGDLEALDQLGIMLKVDLVLNHLSVGSPQFLDMVERGEDSPYRDFFIDWNDFWEGNGERSPDGAIVPAPEHLEKLFMRKPGLPILRVRFPDGSDRFYWNTFYQQVDYLPLTVDDLAGIETEGRVESIVAEVNAAIADGTEVTDLDLGDCTSAVIDIVERNRRYLGQMDLNAESDEVWAFYRETMRNLAGFGVKILRLDAFAYLHKQVGMSNFFNRPGTWDYLDRLRIIAEEFGLVLLPEIHSEYGTGIHEELSDKGYPVYDFFFPGLVIDALDRASNAGLVRWINEIIDRDLAVVNMLGCHDGIPVIDLRGGTRDGKAHDGLLSDERIEAIIDRLLERGGRVKNLYGPDGEKISYYQVNATFFSALGEDEASLRLARALQLFMPGTPQVWYLDLFAGTNDDAAADAGGAGGHKEINRTNLSMSEIAEGLERAIVIDQLDMMRLRTTSSAFAGRLSLDSSDPKRLVMVWTNGDSVATLDADLESKGFTITQTGEGPDQTLTYGPTSMTS